MIKEQAKNAQTAVNIDTVKLAVQNGFQMLQQALGWRRAAGPVKFDFRYILACTADGAAEQSSNNGKLIFLGVCLIAAVRLAREEKWDNSPRGVSRISDSVQLAQPVHERVKREIPHYFSAR